MTHVPQNMGSAINKLLLEIEKDYARQNPQSADKFRSQLEHIVNKKYIKITEGGSVWGFVVNTHDDKKFKRGDILKAQCCNTPARNHARGNVFEGNYVVEWTGPLYMSDLKLHKKKK
tara:strand:- start:8320 stop:8670 length:351 start_codon:yes stop_codon:yes gene_type:complete